MLYNKNYFIYDEKNYTKLDIHGEKMLALNQKQYETYIENDNLSNETDTYTIHQRSHCTIL